MKFPSMSKYLRGDSYITNANNMRSFMSGGKVKRGMGEMEGKENLEEKI